MWKEKTKMIILSRLPLFLMLPVSYTSIRTNFWLVIDLILHSQYSFCYSWPDVGSLSRHIFEVMPGFLDSHLIIRRVIAPRIIAFRAFLLALQSHLEKRLKNPHYSQHQMMHQHLLLDEVLSSLKSHYISLLHWFVNNSFSSSPEKSLVKTEMGKWGVLKCLSAAAAKASHIFSPFWKKLEHQGIFPSCSCL